MAEEKILKTDKEAEVFEIQDPESIELDIAQRKATWDMMKEKYENKIKDKVGEAIEIKLPNGDVKEGKSYETKPIDIAKGISNGLAQAAIAAKVNGKPWDLGRPLEESCELELLKWDSEEAKVIFWHSSSHVLGEALERHFKQFLLCKGPPKKEGGFYYEGFMNGVISPDNYKEIEKVVTRVVKEKQVFERIEVNKPDALEMFKYNKFKVETLKEKVPEDGFCTVYRCGDLIDPCTGPHILHTGRIKAFKVVENSSSYWRANNERESLQRVYGMTFPDKKQLKEWVQIQEEIKNNNHMTIGKKQKLWFRDEVAPGMIFFLPHGQIVFNALVDMMKREQRKRGFQEVQTPNMFHSDLFKKSGHWEKYRDDMFVLEVDGKENYHALKPMNCPGHCVIFQHEKRSYKDLPLRLSDFGVLHRNELRGALGGMVRVRRFQQDDAHIFCRPDQIGEEMKNAFEFLQSIYERFGFTFQLFLSTRPEVYLGEVEVWNEAEKQLEDCLNEFGVEWEKDVGGGAFYGPKIDIKIMDSMQRSHQCATIQLDFQLPQRFDLKYVDAEHNDKRPVMIHRAIYGSLERFLAIITEHLKGFWPFWLSPRQVRVVPLAPKYNDYAEEVAGRFRTLGYHADADVSRLRHLKKIRNASTEGYNIVLVIGENELQAKTANVRLRPDPAEIARVKAENKENKKKEKVPDAVTLGEFKLESLEKVFAELKSSCVDYELSTFKKFQSLPEE